MCSLALRVAMEGAARHLADIDPGAAFLEVPLDLPHLRTAAAFRREDG